MSTFLLIRDFGFHSVIPKESQKGELTMTDLDMKTQSSDTAFIRFWQSLPIVIQAIVLGFIVNTIGVYGWVVIAALLPGLWSIVVMGGVLWVYWKYFSGSWGRWPKATTKARSESFRATTLSPAVWKWGLVAVLLFVVVVQSGLVLTFRLREFPADAFTATYNFDAMPLWVAWLTIVMASLVAGICEETGFRGYGQVPLEKRYGPGVGITIVSLFFLVAHLHQAWAPPILFHIFAISALLGILVYASGSLIPGMIGHTIIDIFSFSYWWSDVLGSFERRTIAETGLDTHFILWILIFAAATTLFFWTIRKLMVVRQQM
ncbi:MAG: type II CAAX prenyl endopeptidase Rce1 family protein [Candidatus Heimdallarchaeota archaeon]